MRADLRPEQINTCAEGKKEKIMAREVMELIDWKALDCIMELAILPTIEELGSA